MDMTAMARMISPDAKPSPSGMPPMAACFKPLFQRGLVRSRILPFGFWKPGEITLRYSYSNHSQNSTLPDLPGYFLSFTTGGRLNRFDLTRFWAPPISFVLLPGGKSSNNLRGIPFRDHFAFLYPYFYNLRYPLFAATVFLPILFLQSWFDPLTVRDASSYQQPHQYAVGIPWVMVNGQVVIENGRHTGALPGQIVA